jgi:hypothetical protein
MSRAGTAMRVHLAPVAFREAYRDAFRDREPLAVTHLAGRN